MIETYYHTAYYTVHIVYTSLHSDKHC